MPAIWLGISIIWDIVDIFFSQLFPLWVPIPFQFYIHFLEALCFFGCVRLLFVIPLRIRLFFHFNCVILFTSAWPSLLQCLSHTLLQFILRHFSNSLLLLWGLIFQIDRLYPLSSKLHLDSKPSQRYLKFNEDHEDLDLCLSFSLSSKSLLHL